MRAVIQRVTAASVTVDSKIVGSIDTGLLILLGITHDDTEAKAASLAAKIWHLRIMRAEKSAAELDAHLLVISQFTLYGDARKGRRPTWSEAAPGHVAEPLYERFCTDMEALGATVERGRFGADMTVQLSNDGPTTLILDV